MRVISKSARTGVRQKDVLDISQQAKAVTRRKKTSLAADHEEAALFVSMVHAHGLPWVFGHLVGSVNHALLRAAMETCLEALVDEEEVEQPSHV